jgi:hypothetical protein
MRAAARTSGVRGTREMRNGRSLGRIPFAAVLVELCAVVLAEFRRAIAAARRYEDLRYRSGRQQGRADADSSRRVFEEFYSCPRPVKSGVDRPTVVVPAKNAVDTAGCAAIMPDGSRAGDARRSIRR